MKHLELRFESGVATVTLNRPEVRNAFNDEVINEMTAVFLELAERARGALHRAGRQRHGVLRRRRPELDEAHGGLRPSRKPGRRRGAGQDAARPLRMPQADHRARPGRRVCRRLRPGRGLRHRGVGGHGQVLPERSAAGADPRDHQPLRDPRHGRARRASLLPHRRARSTRPRRLRIGFVHEVVGAQELDAKVAEHRADAGEERPGGREGLQAAAAGRGEPQDFHGADHHDRRRHCRHPRQRRRPRRACSRSWRSASLPGCCSHSSWTPCTTSSMHRSCWPWRPRSAGPAASGCTRRCCWPARRATWATSTCRRA